MVLSSLSTIFQLYRGGAISNSRKRQAQIAEIDLITYSQAHIQLALFSYVLS
jgi:hypothetical protein